MQANGVNMLCILFAQKVSSCLHFCNKNQLFALSHEHTGKHMVYFHFHAFIHSKGQRYKQKTIPHSQLLLLCLQPESFVLACSTVCAQGGGVPSTLTGPLSVAFQL